MEFESSNADDPVTMTCFSGRLSTSNFKVIPMFGTRCASSIRMRSAEAVSDFSCLPAGSEVPGSSGLPSGQDTFPRKPGVSPARCPVLPEPAGTAGGFLP